MAGRLWPTREQWQKWSVPSRHTLIGLVLAVAGLVLALIFGLPTLLAWLFPCQIETKISTRIVARLYARTDISRLQDARSVEIPFNSQELFYEWTTEFSGYSETASIGIRLDQMDDNDRVTTDPADAEVSGPLPHWVSGFPEPNRKKPDYYSYVIHFSELGKGQRATVKVRRSLKTQSIIEQNLIRVGEISAGRCHVKSFPYNSEADAIRLTQQAKALAKLPIESDPGDVTEKDVQATVEASCQTEDCSTWTIQQLEADMGKSPAQLSRERIQQQSIK